MKNLTVLVLALVTMSFTTVDVNKSEIKTMDAKFNGHAKSSFYFTDLETGKTLKFAKVEVMVMEKYNLKDRSLINQRFNVTYRIDFIEVGSDRKEGKREESKTYKKVLTVTGLELNDEKKLMK